MIVEIGRFSGSSTDVTIEMDITEQELEIVKDVLAAINAVAKGEDWYIMLEQGGAVVPTVKVKASRDSC